MNEIVEEIRKTVEAYSGDESYLVNDDDAVIEHYGIKYRSGRYPYGSGKNPYQRSGDFISRVKQLRDSGMNDKQIAEELGMGSIQEFKLQYAAANDIYKCNRIAQAKRLKEEGWSTTAIGKEMGVNESTVRGWFDENAQARRSAAMNTAEALKEEVAKNKYIDVGAGAEYDLGCSRGKLDEALAILQNEGYEVYGRGQKQVNNGNKQTDIVVLCPPGTEHKDIYNVDLQDIHSAKDHRSTDDGETYHKPFEYPASMDGKRLKINYTSEDGEHGGIEKDGLIELRRGVPDLSLGDARYSQVRILVDGDKYIKGMAVYKDDMPDGVDVIFNTNKKKGTPIEKVLKPIKKDDPNNPFGSAIKEEGGQSWYTGPDGKQHLSLINKRADQGDWQSWDNTLAAQFLSKQNKQLVKRQLKLSMDDREAELQDIQSITNPTLKRKMLLDMAGDCDSTAVHLDACALPRQKWAVIIPDTNLKDNEVYAPQMKDGETVALVRYPHAGQFEIPILKVNNRVKSSEKMIGSDAIDAVCINSKVAAKLSGADFDGDTVLCIPATGKGYKISSQPSLKGLEGFDPKLEYADHKGNHHMTKKQTPIEMGKISNLITDMTIMGASPDEMTRAVKHSMVVIDANKHGLDYMQSAADNRIEELKDRYQGRYNPNTGRMTHPPATIISRAKHETSVPETKGSPRIDKETGELIYKYSGRHKWDKKTNSESPELRTQKSTEMAATKNAMDLVSPEKHPVELYYAAYANELKDIANRCRKEAVNMNLPKRDPSAAEEYKEEVSSLNYKLSEAKKNAPRERDAQRIAMSKINAYLLDNPAANEDKGELKKFSNRQLIEARVQVGAHRTPIDITPNEWKAMQANALSSTKISEIYRYADPEKVREYAMPRDSRGLSEGQKARISNLSRNDYTISEISEALKLPMSTVKSYLQSDKEEN